MKTFIIVVRELCKLVMFTMFWAFPIVLARMFDNTGYLWFFALSLVGTSAMFNHYEDLERTDFIGRNIADITKTADNNEQAE